MALGAYAKRRNFKATPEPAPARFFVQEHHATRHHFDLRLEIDGVLKSWALPKSPSFDPAVSRLAVQVEDHPLAYGSFEGTIPKGNYGAGEVKLWDYGTYVCRSGDPSPALALGHLTLIFEGKKMRGEFALVRSKPGPKDKQIPWLLIKKRDGYAHFGADPLGPRTKLFRPVKARAPSVDIASVDNAVIEPWLAGTRVICVWDGTDARLYSRDLIPVRSPGRGLARRFVKLRPFIAEGVLAGARRTLTLTDLFELDGENVEDRPLLERKRALEAFVTCGPYRVSPLKPASIRWDPVLVRSASAPYRPGIDSSAELVSRESLSRPVAKKSSPTAPSLLTNPTRILWADQKLTKRDLYDYFEAVSDSMLPFLKDRPLSLHRFPNGIKSEGFFQKNLIGFHPAFVRTLALPSASRTLHYPICQNRETLLYLANLACIELNPWLSHSPTLDRPDLLVLDLDPDGNPFGEVCEVALAAKELFEKAKLTPRLKLSGGDGVHIGVKATQFNSYDQARTWLLTLATTLQKQFPRLTSLDRKPALRRKKIYLDCFQNARGQTIVAPLSPRPRPGAPVSIPLRWDELRSSIRPTDFSISLVPARIRDLRNSCVDLWDVGLCTPG